MCVEWFVSEFYWTVVSFKVWFNWTICFVMLNSNDFTCNQLLKQCNCKTWWCFVELPCPFFDFQVLDLLPRSCFDIIGLTLLDWHYWIDIIELTLLDWNYWIDIIELTQDCKNLCKKLVVSLYFKEPKLSAKFETLWN